MFGLKYLNVGIRQNLISLFFFECKDFYRIKQYLQVIRLILDFNKMNHFFLGGI
jgi:hypothetical protein